MRVRSRVLVFMYSLVLKTRHTGLSFGTLTPTYSLQTRLGRRCWGHVPNERPVSLFEHQRLSRASISLQGSARTCFVKVNQSEKEYDVREYTW